MTQVPKIKVYFFIFGVVKSLHLVKLKWWVCIENGFNLIFSSCFSSYCAVCFCAPQIRIMRWNSAFFMWKTIRVLSSRLQTTLGTTSSGACPPCPLSGPSLRPPSQRSIMGSSWSTRSWASRTCTPSGSTWPPTTTLTSGWVGRLFWLYLTLTLSDSVSLCHTLSDSDCPKRKKKHFGKLAFNKMKLEKNPKTF